MNNQRANRVSGITLIQGSPGYFARGLRGAVI